MQTHLLADAIARIMNAQRAHKKIVILFFSNLIKEVLRVLVNEGYVYGQTSYVERKGVSMIQVYLKYTDQNNPVISEFKLLSKPGRKIYSTYNTILKNYNKLGTTLLSTSRGVLTNYRAIRLRLGGEVLCSIF